MIQTIDIDIRGHICPSCLLLTLKEMNNNVAAIRTGNTELVVVTDDRQATTTIPAMADRMGFCAEVVRMDDGYHIRIYRCNIGTTP
ncbi:MAG TPA: sulfurtransferase TusA family protein [Desulfobulbaceae bacterium]|nr:MAG: tRNA methyltransferase [Deltaproteobacteria bacterium RIFOXYD12_FULL_53_23]HCC53812.1 sulfurtransferase TusA family protein [Desulfobulbaceae bacterium]